MQSTQQKVAPRQPWVSAAFLRRDAWQTEQLNVTILLLLPLLLLLQMLLVFFFVVLLLSLLLLLLRNLMLLQVPLPWQPLLLLQLLLQLRVLGCCC